jgi:Domain of unknown function (DUF4349)
MTTRNSVLCLLLVFLLMGCATQASVEGPAMAPMPAPAVEMEAAEEMDFAADEGSAGIAFDEARVTSQTASVQNAVQDRVIIRTGDMSIVVVDTEEAMSTIAAMVGDNGGWVVSSSVFQYADDAMTGNMSVRIPAEGFDSFLEAVGRLSVEVTRISTSGQDVTEEYVDLSARLDNLETTADRVRNFMDEAKTVEEALEVSRELSSLEGEIEALKGRLQYLDQSAAFSLITIDLTPDILAQPLEVGGWQPQGAARSALETLVATLQTLVDAAIWLVIYVLPILLIIGIPAWLIIRTIRRRRAARASEIADLPQEETEN